MLNDVGESCCSVANFRTKSVSEPDMVVGSAWATVCTAGQTAAVMNGIVEAPPR